MSNTYKKPTPPPSGTTCGEVFPTHISANYRIPSLVRLNDGNTNGITLYLIADLFPAGYSISSVSTTHTLTEAGTGFNTEGHLLLSNDDRKHYCFYLDNNTIHHQDGSILPDYRVDSAFNLWCNNLYISNLFYTDSPFKVPAVSYICMMQSTDGGTTWSAPYLINIKPKDAPWVVVGPDSGLITKNGRLAFTAYDGDHIYLVYYQDGWHTVRSDAASNESTLVELNDGTLRAFVKRKGANTIAYIDFVPCNGHYHPTALFDTGVSNFSNCMISSLYSSDSAGHNRIHVCCPSASEGGTWGGRFRGIVYDWAVEADNSLTLVNKRPVNDGFFAYSSMVQLPSGDIALLYEDDCKSYPAGHYAGKASHIQYTILSRPR